MSYYKPKINGTVLPYGNHYPEPFNHPFSIRVFWMRCESIPTPGSIIYSHRYLHRHRYLHSTLPLIRRVSFDHRDPQIPFTSAPSAIPWSHLPRPPTDTPSDRPSTCDQFAKTRRWSPEGQLLQEFRDWLLEGLRSNCFFCVCCFHWWPMFATT